MNPILTEISKELQIPSQELINRGLLAYLEHELRLAEEEVADIREKYSVGSFKELQKQIKRKEIQSHPAWEDLIAWENIEIYIDILKKRIEKTRKTLD